MRAPALWDLFCRVVDNYGDIGVCWRLAADLAARGQAVRLWVDDPGALQWMAPQGAPGVEVQPWTAQPTPLASGEVVIEAFGCDPPADFVSRMAQRANPPLWINLEYLSAQDYVARCHGLPSPQTSGPGAGLRKWFFFPGFGPDTGGLIRERGLMRARAAFDAASWLRSRAIERRRGERLASMFCYPHAPLDELLTDLATQPTLLLLTPGAARTAVREARTLPATLRCVDLPWLTQPDYDRLLWACDLNFVRGEDSLVRAIWAGAPFVWQIYPQRDAAHKDKLDALLRLLLQDAQPELGVLLRALWRGWNGLAPWPARWPEQWAWEEATLRLRDALVAQPDLATRLLRFVREKG